MSTHRLISQLGRLEDLDIEKAVRKGALYVQAVAKGLAPVKDGELRESILVDVKKTEPDVVEGYVYTNLRYAPYVEFGTGPKGQAEHSGIAPDIAVAYRQSPWWVHESQLSPDAGEYYHWFHIDTPDGRFYKMYGQAAQPFMYPALKDNEEDIVEIIASELRAEVKKCVT